MNAQPVDVLAVMGEGALHLSVAYSVSSREMHEARAAVAELFKTLDTVQHGLSAPSGLHPDAMTKEVAAKKIRAALAACGVKS